MISMRLSVFRFYALALCVFALGACASSTPAPSVATTAPAFSAPLTRADNNSSNVFTLSSGDRLRVRVFGDDALSGEYDIDARGVITMPLIGEIRASGQSVDDVKTQITEKLDTGFLVNPRVSIEVISLRPFYILGEVNTPGSYPTFPEFDVFKAIATAGGLTPRAVKGKYIIYRGSGANRRAIEASDETPVFPGDSIKVKERFF